ncbi:amidohydrolase family protein [Pinirhizobacter sp.]|jgi:L-fuconolactonase|uniref:amidohydrolase family protein n=1 Tax=Pinirhizobacter sp. TaxID=2950432 RepID=UPI002F3F83D0
MIVDAHQHYWKPSRGDYGWLAGAPASLRQDFLPQDIAAIRDEAGVEACVLVQAAPSEDETRFLFELARQDASVAGVVGWVDFEAPDVDSRIAALAIDGRNLLVGLRPMAQDIEDPDWLDSACIDAAFTSLHARELAFDALVGPSQWPALQRRLDREPRLRVAVDHGAKPDLADGSFSRWATCIERLARYPNVHCKFSGLLTQLTPDQDPSTITPYVEHLFSSFGPARLMWGSDWPVATLRCDYATWLRLALRYVRALTPDHEAALMGGNAARFYRLDLSRQSLPAHAMARQ